MSWYFVNIVLITQLLLTPPGWFPQQGRPSLRCSESYIGSKCQSASSSVYACWRTAVFTAQRQATLPRPFVQFPALLRGVISDLLTCRLCWCRQLAVRHWVTARFRRLKQEPRIRCLVMSGTCLPCSPSAANSRLYCLGCRTLSTDSFSTVSWHWYCKVVLQQ